MRSIAGQAAACPLPGVTPTEQSGDQGYTVIPNALLQQQKAMDLTPDELCLLVHLISFRWGNGLVIPSVRLLAERTNSYDRWVQRTLRSLESKGIVITEVRSRKNGSQTSNRYVLAPVVTDLLSPVGDDAAPGGDRSSPVLQGATDRHRPEEPRTKTHQKKDQLPRGYLTQAELIELERQRAGAEAHKYLHPGVKT